MMYFPEEPSNSSLPCSKGSIDIMELVLIWVCDKDIVIITQKESLCIRGKVFTGEIMYTWDLR